MKIKRLNQELEQFLEENTEYSISDEEKAELWDMVKDFDKYISKNESLNEDIINEVLKSECGFELQPASIELIPNKSKYNLPEYENSFNLSQKIQWLIEFLNTVNKKDIIGLKLSNCGTIEYKINRKKQSKHFIIPMGLCLRNSVNLIFNAELYFGMFHMKYGKNKHWNKSINALKELSKEFENPVWVIPNKSTTGKYNYVFYSANGYKYAFGVPKDKFSETILISCY